MYLENSVLDFSDFEFKTLVQIKSYKPYRKIVIDVLEMFGVR